MKLFIFVILTGMAALTFFIIRNRPQEPMRLESKLYENMASRFFLSNGLVMSAPSRTTSESMAYGMMASLSEGDREHFDKIWGWIRANLQVRDDKLFGWIWDNGIVTDKNSASDADIDIAWSLLRAAKKWDNPKYAAEALPIIRDSWAYDTAEAGGARYMVAGSWAGGQDAIYINPSYLSPYAYREFAKVDQSHDWESLVDSSYKALSLCAGGANLVRDWCKLDKNGEVVSPFTLPPHDNPEIYSYDAIRTFFRVALDYSMNNEPRARDFLLRSQTTLLRDWNSKRKIFAEYSMDGVPLKNYDSAAAYGNYLAMLSVTDRTAADEVYDKKIGNIRPSRQITFYDLSWMLFGIHFYRTHSLL